jgi:iron complex transport system permease protein
MPTTRRFIATSGLLALAAGLLFMVVVFIRPSVPGDPAVAKALDQVLLWHSVLPRGAAALLCGAALGLSGALLQRVLRNPIADPSTLGIASGAQLALTFATVYAPSLIAFSREGVALAGGAIAVGIVLALNLRRGLEPVTVVLSGMVISLVAAALSAALVLAKGEYVLSLYIWGAGALNQQNWDVVLALAPRLVAGCLAAILLLRPLAILGLDDAAARSLGLALSSTRFLVIALAVWLAATTTAMVGIVGFIGLAAPAFARVSGARTQAQVLTMSVLAGAVALSLTDSAVQLLGSGFNDLAPTGAATALLGSPLLLWLLTRIRTITRAPLAAQVLQRRRIASPRRVIVWIILATAAMAGLTLCLGPTADGWHVGSGHLLTELLPFRAPRIVAAGAAGAMLGAAGTLMQRLTGNPLAGPEVLGVSVGAGVGLAAALFVAPLDPAYRLLGLTTGALVTLIVMLGIASRSGYGPDRLLLAGIGIGALCTAIISTVMAQGDMRSYALLIWISGSTNNAGDLEACVGIVSTLILILPLMLFSRWLDILPLGEDTTRSVGLALRRSRLILALFAALLTAIASFLIGPLSLVGLIAPHLARLIGFARGRDQLVAAVLVGCGVMIAADWLSRAVAYPYEVPVGLFASLIGGPYLLWLLSRGEAKQV